MERKRITSYPEYMTCGSEGEIFIVKDGIYKKYTLRTSPIKLKRKENILLYLDKLNELKKYYPEIRYLVNSIIPLYIRGYVMQPIIGGSLDNAIYTNEEKLNILLQLKDILDEFRKHGLYYFDIRRPNIKITDKEHKPILLDIDGLIEEGEKMDATPYYITEYIKNGGQLDEHAQILMFNRFTLLCFPYNELRYDFEYDSEGKEIMTDYKRMDSAFDHEYLCNHMKIKER